MAYSDNAESFKQKVQVFLSLPPQTSIFTVTVVDCNRGESPMACRPDLARSHFCTARELRTEFTFSNDWGENEKKHNISLQVKIM